MIMNGQSRVTYYLWAHLGSMLPSKLNEDPVYSMPPGFLQELPLAVAVRAAAVDCVKLLLEYGADPDAVCRKNEKNAARAGAGGRQPGNPCFV